MFEIISKSGNLYNILDTSDGVVDSVSVSDLLSVMMDGTYIKGAWHTESKLYTEIDNTYHSLPIQEADIIDINPEPQKAVSIKPFDGVDAVAQAKPVELSEPVEIAESVEPLEIAQEAEPLEIANPIEPVDTADSIEFDDGLDAVDLFKSVDAVDFIEFDDVVDTSDSIELEDVMNIIDSSEFDDTVDLFKPVDTVNQAQTANLVDAVETSEPIEASDGVDSAEPVEPVDAVTPSEPVEPPNQAQTAVSSVPVETSPDSKAVFGVEPTLMNPAVSSKPVDASPKPSTILGVEPKPAPATTKPPQPLKIVMNFVDIHHNSLFYGVYFSNNKVRVVTPAWVRQYCSSGRTLGNMTLSKRETKESILVDFNVQYSIVCTDPKHIDDTVRRFQSGDLHKRSRDGYDFPYCIYELLTNSAWKP